MTLLLLYVAHTGGSSTAVATISPQNKLQDLTVCLSLWSIESKQHLINHKNDCSWFHVMVR